MTASAVGLLCLIAITTVVVTALPQQGQQCNRFCKKPGSNTYQCCAHDTRPGSCRWQHPSSCSQPTTGRQCNVDDMCHSNEKCCYSPCWGASFCESVVLGNTDPTGGNIGQNPGGNFGQNPDGNFGQNPGGNFGQNPGGNFGQNPVGNLGQNPGGNFGQNPGGNLGQNPGINPGVNPGINPGVQPGAGGSPNPGVGGGLHTGIDIRVVG